MTPVNYRNVGKGGKRKKDLSQPTVSGGFEARHPDTRANRCVTNTSFCDVFYTM